MRISKANTIAVTGANGFLGRHTIHQAIKKKYYIKGIVRSQTAAEIVASMGAKSVESPTLEKKKLVSALRGCRGVIHFIGITSGTPEQFDIVNVGSVRKILDASVGAGIARFVIPTGLGVDQVGKAPWANNAYFKSKADIEALITASPVNYTIFRPSYILGPGDELIPWIIDQLRQGVVSVIGKGTTPMQPIFVRDAVNVFLAAVLGKGSDRKTYDLVGPETITMRELIDRVAEAVAGLEGKWSDYKIRAIPLNNAAKNLGISKEDVDVSQCDSIGDNSSVREELGLRLTSLAEAIQTAVVAKLQADQKEETVKS